jgi:hypothetical protein
MKSQFRRLCFICGRRVSYKHYLKIVYKNYRDATYFWCHRWCLYNCPTKVREIIKKRRH